MSEKLEAFVAKRIRELRTQLGLSMRQLAQRSGLPPEMVSRAERQVSSPSVGTLGQLCKGLGVEPGEFFSRSAKLELTSPAIAQRIQGLVADLTPRQQDEVLRGLELLLEVRVAKAAPATKPPR